MKQLILLFSLLYVGITLLPAQYGYTQKEELYTINNGLSGYFANFTFKDSRGIIWIGTQQGLHRFDGREFRVFNTNDGLVFNEVMEIFEDAEGYLWLYRSCHRKPKDYCFKALHFFHNTEHKVLTVEERFPNGLPFLIEDIENICSNRSGKAIIVQTKEKSYRYNGANGFETLNFATKNSHPYIFQILEDGKIGAFSKQDPNFWNIDDRARQLLNPKDEYYLYSAKGQLIKYNQVSSLIGSFKGSTNLLSVNNTFKGLLNVNAQGRKYLFHLKENGELHYAGLLNDELNPPYNARHYFFDWEENTLWAAGAEGVTRTELVSSKFHLLNFDTEKNFGAMIQYIGLHPGDGLVMASAESIYKTNIEELHEADYENYGRLPSSLPVLSGNHLPINEFPFSDGFAPLPQTGILHKNKDGNFYLDKLFWQNEEGKKISLGVNIHRWQKSKYLLGTNEGLFIVDPKEKNAQQATKGLYADLLTQAVVNSILPLDEDLSWLGTNKGLFLYSQNEGIKNYYGPEREDEGKLPLSVIYDIEKISEDSLWLACRNGLFLIKGLISNKPQYQKFQVAEGLPDNNCVAIIKDDYGFLWIATIKGLVQMDERSHQMKIHNAQNGLPQEYFIEKVRLKDNKGRIYIGGNKGVVYFDPKEFKEEQFAPPTTPLSIVEYEQYNGQTEQFELKTAALLRSQRINLYPNSKVFSLRVALSDHRGANKQRYAYRIKGVQDQWIEDQSNLLRFSGLPYGKHLLEIRGRLADGRYSSEHLNIPIEVFRPFYFRWWFLLICLIIIVLGVITYFKGRTYILKKEQKRLERKVLQRTQKIEKDKVIIARQAAELKKMDELKTRFFANVSHELRTPLTLMLGPIESVLKNDAVNNRDFTLLKLAQKSGRDLQRLVDELLTLMKFENHNIELKETPTDLLAFLERIAASFESHAKRLNILFSFHFETTQNIVLLFDQNKMEKVLNNLLSNAMKFTDVGGSVRLKVKDLTNRIQILIEDTGQGIHEEDLPYIFERFYQSQKNQSNSSAGTGIGLALSKEFAQLMDAKLWAESSYGEGSRFFVEFPKKVVLSPGKEIATPDKVIGGVAIPKLNPNPNYKLQHNPSLLLVEDNVNMAQYIQLILGSNWKIECFSNGQEALVFLADRKKKSDENKLPDLILTDLMMPIMDGYQFTDILKKDPKLNHIPILMLTARAEKEDKLKALRLGVDDYLVKPFDEDELRARLSNLLQNSLQRKTNLTRDNPLNLELEKFNQAEDSLPIDQAWLEELEEVAIKNLKNPDFLVDQLAQQMASSRWTLNRKIKSLTGLTASQYLLEARLQKARQLLMVGFSDSIKMLSLEVGLKDPKYFSQLFKKRFGRSPKNYL